MSSGLRIAVVSLLLVVTSVSSVSFGQSAKKLPGGEGLMVYAPKDAVFFLERRGHTAVKKAFAASNLGKLAKDEAMNEFIHGTRVKIGEMIVKEMFSLKNPVEIQAHQKTLHGFLKAFWYQPTAAVVTVTKEGPQFYFICQTGDYQKECKQAIEKLMSVGVAPPATAGKRQAFMHKSSGIDWKGVAKGWQNFELSNDPAKLPGELRRKTVFMTAWKGKTLCVAMSLTAADRASSLLVKPAPEKSILTSESVAIIAAKTHIKDWAFRWHVNLEPVFELAGDRMNDERGPGKIMTVLGLTSMRGLGGTGGYLDNVYTRMTYADAPNCNGLFKRGGSYKKALAMTPEGAAFTLAGQFNTDWIGTTIGNLVGNPDVPEPGQPPRENPVMTQVKALLANSDGNGTVFLTSLPALMGGMMGGGPPIGFVMDVKDPAKATKAMEALAKLAGARRKDNDKPLKPYRKIKIVKMADTMHVAVTKDRMIIAAGQAAMTAAIDAALDDTGGLGDDSKTAKLLKLAGDGSAMFQMDMPHVVKTLWPLLLSVSQQAEQRGRNDDFPLTSMPSAGKMARMLGPEVAVFKPDKGGLLLKSRGTIPLITKIVPTMPIASGGFFFMMMMR